jgi:hypothetical protein
MRRDIFVTNYVTCGDRKTKGTQLRRQEKEGPIRAKILGSQNLRSLFQIK